MMQFLLRQNLKYKILFLLTGFCFNTAMLVPELYYVLNKSFFIHTGMIKLQVSHFIFVLINVGASTTLPSRQMLYFLINANATGILFSVLMIPLCIMNNFISITALVNDVFLLMIFLIMIIEYKRWMRNIHLWENRFIIITDAIAALLFIAYLVFG